MVVLLGWLVGVRDEPRGPRGPRGRSTGVGPGCCQRGEEEETERKGFRYAIVAFLEECLHPCLKNTRAETTACDVQVGGPLEEKKERVGGFLECCLQPRASVCQTKPEPLKLPTALPQTFRTASGRSVK